MGSSQRYGASLGLSVCALFLLLLFIPAHHASGQAAAPRPLVRDARYAITQLPDGPKFSLCVTHDNQGNVWVGTQQNGVWCWRGGQWQQFHVGDGLGDTSAYAIACDHDGRIWVGHQNQGVSVYCQGQWRNYSIENGPSGQHVNAIAVCPTDGDVWMASEAGLSRYSPARKIWQYYNRSTGLPTDQIASVAFDATGNMVLGTACEGIVLLDAADDYAKPRQIIGSDAIPQQHVGSGLPSNCINQVLVAHDGTLYAATTHGLARSRNHGISWYFIRGADWQQIARGSYEGVPPDWNPDGTGELAEDWVTSLAEDQTGVLWLGYRSKGWQAFDVASNAPLSAKQTRTPYVDAVSAAPDGLIVAASYLDPVYQFKPTAALNRPIVVTAPAPGGDGSQAAFVEPAPTPKPSEIEHFLARVNALKKAAEPSAVYLRQDWASRGDWCGRYGRQYAALSGAGFNTHNYGDSQRYNVDYLVGPFFPGGSVFTYDWGKTGIDPVAAPWDPLQADRYQAGCNDGSFTIKDFPLTNQGPDLYVGVTVPQGTHRISLYLISPDGTRGNNIYRDYLVEIKAPIPGQTAVGPRAFDQEDLIPVELAPSLARSRASWLYAGAYHQFLVNGAGTWWIKISRNHSFVTQISGVFIDRLAPLGAEAQRESLNFPQLATLQPPNPPDNGPLLEPRQLWDALDHAANCQGIGDLDWFGRLLVYRVGVGVSADPDLLAYWRWRMQIWNDQDHTQFFDFTRASAAAKGGTPPGNQ